MGQQFHSRTHRRVPIHGTALYMGPDFVGHATILNLSMSGLHLMGTYPVPAKARLTIRLYLSDDDAYVQIPSAIVRWTTGHEFGVRLSQLPESARCRLLARVTDLARHTQDASALVLTCR